METARGRGPNLHLLDKRNYCEIGRVGRLDAGDGRLGREHYMKGCKLPVVRPKMALLSLQLSLRGIVVNHPVLCFSPPFSGCRLTDEPGPSLDSLLTLI